MKNLRFFIMALAFGVLGVSLSSCDKEEKATISFVGSIDDVMANVYDFYPLDNAYLEDRNTMAIKNLKYTNFSFHFEFYARANGYSEDEYFAGQIAIKVNFLGVVYDADGNEVRRETESFTRRLGENDSPIVDETGLFIHILADAGETIQLSVTSIDYDGTVSKRFKSFYVNINGSYDCKSGGETYQFGEFEFSGGASR